VLELLQGWADVEVVEAADILRFDGCALPQDGRYTVLASTHRMRYPADRPAWRPDLHLVLWNPFQAWDVDAPTLVSWGHGRGGLQAVRQWLQGLATASGTHPIPLP
jgi:beta-N-acetylhexosaminidase